MLEYPRYDKSRLSSVDGVQAVHYALTVFALDPLPRMYVSLIIITLRPT